jgi:hypothetical protein
VPELKNLKNFNDGMEKFVTAQVAMNRQISLPILSSFFVLCIPFVFCLSPPPSRTDALPDLLINFNQHPGEKGKVKNKETTAFLDST